MARVIKRNAGKRQDLYPPSEENRQIHRGDVFWTDFPEGLASIGSCPAVVIQNNTGNRFSSSVIMLPITSNLSSKRYPVNVDIPGSYLGKPSEIRANQIVAVDKSLLTKKIVHLPNEIMDKVDDALRVSLGLPRCE